MTKVNKYLLATKNTGKVSELSQILATVGISVTDLTQTPFPDVEETGKTFAENAELKAVAGCLHTGLPTIADDSGLCVDLLAGAPGIYTARYGGFVKLLKNLEDFQNPIERTATFCCDICLAIPSKGTSQPIEIHHFYGECKGFITLEARGEGGFGYDPVFSLTPNGQTWAESNTEAKKKVSHRAKALQKLYAHLNPL